MPESTARTVTEAWNVVFRHSAGRLGSHFLRSLGERRIVGWKSGAPARVRVPPRDLGLPGEWIDVGPGATLIAFAPPGWVDRTDDEASGCVALVRPDGADTAMLARVRGPLAALATGARLVARFDDSPRGAITDLWFEPVEVVC